VREGGGELEAAVSVGRDETRRPVPAAQLVPGHCP